MEQLIGVCISLWVYESDKTSSTGTTTQWNQTVENEDSKVTALSVLLKTIHGIGTSGNVALEPLRKAAWTLLRTAVTEDSELNWASVVQSVLAPQLSSNLGLEGERSSGNESTVGQVINI